MKKIKKLLAGFAALLVLTGCSSLNAERVDCCECWDSVTRWIDLASGEHVCATCFEKRGYQICLDCKRGYDPDDGGADGYCEGCAEKDTPAFSARNEKALRILSNWMIARIYALNAYTARPILTMITMTGITMATMMGRRLDTIPGIQRAYRKGKRQLSRQHPRPAVQAVRPMG